MDSACYGHSACQNIIGVTEQQQQQVIAQVFINNYSRLQREPAYK
jgi:hypothetical protein